LLATYRVLRASLLFLVYIMSIADLKFAFILYLYL
jgi:hypothetical protein